MVGFRTGRNDGHRELIDTITTVDGGVRVIIRTIGEVVLSVPTKYRSLRQISVFLAVERSRFVEVNALDTVTTVDQRGGVVHNCVLGVGLTVPCDLVAEDECANGALGRKNSQGQMVYTVLAGAGFVFHLILLRSRDATQTT